MDEGPGRTPFAFIVFLLAFRLLADIHPALGSGGGFQLLQGQFDGGVTVARCFTLSSAVFYSSDPWQRHQGEPSAR